MYKNMKIEINEKQPLGEVVKELERLGWIPLNKFAIKPDYHKWLVADCDGFVLGWRNALILGDNYYKTTTLAELRSMNIEQLKEM